ncbi:MAG: hypothetical protein GXP32_04990 [Kiritimatiellaeota bacterium]|nr:hypothetical protein [Kiritimatiellota bacterium]
MSNKQNDIGKRKIWGVAFAFIIGVPFLRHSLIGTILGGNAAKVFATQVAPERERMMEVIENE